MPGGLLELCLGFRQIRLADAGHVLLLLGNRGLLRRCKANNRHAKKSDHQGNKQLLHYYLHTKHHEITVRSLDTK